MDICRERLAMADNVDAKTFDFRNPPPHIRELMRKEGIELHPLALENA
jgi:hypothetical protein